MPRPSLASSLASGAVPELGCVGLPSDAGLPVLATHVQDWRDEVIYQVIVDRFADGDLNNDFSIQPGALARYQGGDWLGLEQNLGYIQSLGATTVWISPVVKNVFTNADVDGYHGYWAQDLTQLEPILRGPRLAPLHGHGGARARDEGRPRHRLQPHGAALLL